MNMAQERGTSGKRKVDVLILKHGGAQILSWLGLEDRVQVADMTE